MEQRSHQYSSSNLGRELSPSKCPSHATTAERLCSFVCSHLMQVCQSRTALCIGPNVCCHLISAPNVMLPLQVEDLKRKNNKRPVMARVNAVDN